MNSIYILFREKSFSFNKKDEDGKGPEIVGYTEDTKLAREWLWSSDENERRWYELTKPISDIKRIIKW